MKALLYKEFRLMVHPLFYLVPLFGALLLIPQWPYFIAMMYFFFLTASNILVASKTQNDIGFSAMLPIRRRDIAKARIASVGILELLQLAVAAIFIPLNMKLYPNGNFLMDANIAFLGLNFVMYGIFNLVLFPMFYKTAYKIAGPMIASLAVTTLFAFAVEMIVKIFPFAQAIGGRENLSTQSAVLICGILIFFLMTIWAYRISAKRFERVDL